MKKSDSRKSDQKINIFSKNINIIVLLLAVIVFGGAIFLSTDMGKSITGIEINPFSSHAQKWGDYHWGRTQNPFVAILNDNVGRTWDSSLDMAIKNWSTSAMFDMQKAAGTVNPIQCPIESGKIQVCNAKYGQTGWYGLTNITTNGAVITGASVKLNDSYKQSSQYKNMIACHEIGHAMGLWHQDETFGNPNINTCLDFTNNPATNQQPNARDYQDLEEIYSAIDTFTSLASGGAAVGGADVNDYKSPKNWGKLIRKEKDSIMIFERDLGSGKKLITEAIMVPGEELAEENPEQ